MDFLTSPIFIISAISVVILVGIFVYYSRENANLNQKVTDITVNQDKRMNDIFIYFKEVENKYVNMRRLYSELESTVYDMEDCMKRNTSLNYFVSRDSRDSRDIRDPRNRDFRNIRDRGPQDRDRSPQDRDFRDDRDRDRGSRVAHGSKGDPETEALRERLDRLNSGLSDLR
jgi:hypothetical protein